MKHAIAAFMLCLGAAAPTLAAPADKASGYVVRVDSVAVYLDFGLGSGAAPGQPFTVYAEGEELKHPVTGASLGRVEKPLAKGTIREVMAQYSVGALGSATVEVKAGMRARLGAPPPPQIVTAVEGTPGGVPLRAPRWKGPIFDYQATGMAVSDFRGGGAEQVVLSDTKTVFLYPYPPQDAKPIARFTVPGNAPRILSLEAADLNGNGRSEVFVSLYNGTFERFETLILELDGEKLAQVAEIPGVVRSHQDKGGKPILAVQQLVDDSSFPFGNIYPLAFQDGKYSAGKTATRPRRVEWIYDFNMANLADSEAVLLLTSNERLRVQFGKKYWKTPDSYCQTPSRVRWKGRLLHFRPPMPVAYGEGAQARIYLVKNLSVLGSLSEPFGLFNNAEIHRKSWSGLSLASDWKSDLGGYSTGISVVGGPADPKELAVAVVGTSGKSSVWIYDP